MASEKIGDAFIEISAKFDKLEKELEKIDGKLTKSIVKPAKAASNSVKGLENRIKALADSQSLTTNKKDWQKIQKEIDGTKRKIESISGKTTSALGSAFKRIGTLAAGAFAVTKITAFAKESVALAGELEGVKQAFDRLNDATLLDSLRKATRGTVSDLELMKSAVKAKNFKVPLEKLGSFFEFATKRAAQTGESVDFLVESIVNGIGRKSSLVLDNLGISATELQDEIKKVGDFGLAAGNIIDRELGKMGDVAITSAQEFAKVSAEIDNLKTQIGTKLIPIVKDLLKFTVDVAKGWEIVFGEATTGGNQFEKAIKKAMESGGQLMGEARIGAKQFKDEIGGIVGNSEKLKAEIKRLNTESARFIKLGNTFGEGYIEKAAIATLTAKELEKSLRLINKTATENTIEEQAESSVMTLGELSQSLKQLKIDQDLSTNNQQWQSWQDQIAGVQGKIDTLTGKFKTFGDTAEAEGPIELATKQIGDLINETERLNSIQLAPPTITDESLEKLQAQKDLLEQTGLVTNAVQGAFMSMGNIMAASFGQAETAGQAFAQTLGSLALDLISQALAVSIGNAITGATASGAATGPAAIFTTPAFIATAVGGVIAAFASIPAFATGGQAPGGTALVGERGPEFVNLPRNAMISPNHELNRLDGKFGGAMNVNVNGDIRGNDIFLSNSRTGTTRTRTRG